MARVDPIDFGQCFGDGALFKAQSSSCFMSGPFPSTGLFASGIKGVLGIIGSHPFSRPVAKSA